MVLCKRFTNVASMVSLLKIESEEGNSFFYSENMKFINYPIIPNASLWAILNEAALTCCTQLCLGWGKEGGQNALLT